MVAVIANAIECSSFWNMLMTDYVQHMGALKQFGPKLKEFRQCLKSVELTVKGVDELGSIVSQLHLLREALRSGACTSLEDDALQILKAFIQQCRVKAELEDTQVITAMQRTLSDAVIHWPEDAELADALQSFGELLRQKNFQSKVNDYDEAVNACSELHKADSLDKEAVLQAWQYVQSLAAEAELEAALLSGGATWKESTSELLELGFAFWAKEVFAAKNYKEAEEAIKVVTQTMERLVQVLGDKQQSSCLTMFEAASSSIKAFHDLQELGQTLAEIILADEKMEALAALKRAVVQWGGCEKVTEVVAGGLSL